MQIDGLPLHPIVVHMPVALALISPLVAGVVFWAIKTGRWQRSVWAGVVAVNVVLVLSSFVALKTGEQEEDVVESVVGDAPIHDHEENAEAFLIATAVLAALSAAALFLKQAKLQEMLMGASCVSGLVVLALAVVTGHSGGQLVYKHNAGAAYSSGSGMPVRTESEGDHDDD